MTKQLLLFADQRPLVERLGADFFKQAPQCPGVYLMRSASEEVLYIGKARNLRKRLGSYRVANPDRMSRRHLRLVSAVKRIELFKCESENSAIAKEAALLLNLKPRFNRAGTWSAPMKYIVWRFEDAGVTLAVTSSAEPGWRSIAARGVWTRTVQNTLLRRLWCGLFPERGICGMPPGWAQGKCGDVVTILASAALVKHHGLAELLDSFAQQDAQPLLDWVQAVVPENDHPFEAQARNEDIELLGEIYQTA